MPTAELTDALDGGILGVELPASGHDHELRQEEPNRDLGLREVVTAARLSEVCSMTVKR